MGVREWKMCVVVWCVCECVDVWRVCECVCVVNKDISQSAECFFYSFRFQSGRGGEGAGREGHAKIATKDNPGIEKINSICMVAIEYCNIMECQIMIKILDDNKKHPYGAMRIFVYSYSPDGRYPYRF